MQFKASLVALAFAASTVAQDLSQLPECATGPALQAFQSSSCGTTDIACICNDTAFLEGLQSQVAEACSPEDLATATSFAASLCASAGVELPQSTPEVAPTTAATPTADVTTAVTVSPTDAVITIPTDTSPIVTGTGTGTPGPYPNSTTISTGPPTPIFTGAAANFAVQGGVVALAGAAAAFFAL